MQSTTAPSRTRRTASLLALVLAVLTAGFVALSAHSARADGAPVVLSAGSWFGGNGNAVCSSSTATTCGGETHVGGISTNWWQCVELVQRFYNDSRRGWYSGTFAGVNVAADIYTQAANGKLANMSAQANNSVTSIVAGDMFVFSGGSDSAGHVGIVDSVVDNGNGTKMVNVVNQNTQSVRTTSTWNVAARSLTNYLGGSYTVSGIVHSTMNTGSSSAGGSYRAAFQANTGSMYTFDSSSGAANTQQGLASGTSPAITAVAAGHQEAFQAAGSSYLYVYGNVSNGNTAQGMMPGTSPAIAALPSGNDFEVAFQVNTGALYTYHHSSSGDTVTPTNLGLWTGTSPSIAALAGGGYEVAFQAAGSGALWVYGSAGMVNTGLGMMAGTSPSISASPNGGFRVAFQANTGVLWTYDSSGGPTNTGQGMASRTSPAIAGLTTGGYEEAFQAAGSNMLYVFGSNSSGNTQQGMMSGTSPSIAPQAGGNFAVAFQANTGYLFTYSSATGGALNTLQGMASGTSPSIGQ